MARFPLAKVPELGYHKGSGKRWFGASRDKGRNHAACDLVVKPGTPVYAVEAGVVLQVPKTAFFQETYSVVIKHPNFVVRYAELDINRLVKEGESVTEGQQIGTVGKNYKGRGMLHFEMYAGTSGGNLSQPKNNKYLYVPERNYMRRSDLIDPTEYLDWWKLWTPFDNWWDGTSN
jgi:murein DD-endopeptidase MepM/ murein hydrolase activator NlpD